MQKYDKNIPNFLLIKKSGYCIYIFSCLIFLLLLNLQQWLSQRVIYVSAHILQGTRKKATQLSSSLSCSCPCHYPFVHNIWEKKHVFLIRFLQSISVATHYYRLVTVLWGVKNVRRAICSNSKVNVWSCCQQVWHPAIKRRNEVTKTETK